VGAPGVVELETGARVADAVDAAGGLLPDADVSRVNLARVLADGEQLHVPRPGEPLAGESAQGPVEVGAGAAGGGPDADGGGPAGGRVDLNTATLEQLQTLPGIGPVLGQRILDWRAQNGRFSTVDELGEVSGIGPRVLEGLRPLATVG
jgi:competence protein ComEA